MRLTWLIAGHELRRLFASMLAWCVLGVSQLLTGLLFTLSLLRISADPAQIGPYDGVSEVVGAGLFRFAMLLLLLVVPLLTMRVFADERKTGTLELLLAAPVGLAAVVLGKFLGLMGYLSLLLAAIAAMPAALIAFTPLDTGVIAAGALGLWLTAVAFTAVGVFVSALTREPVLAAVATLGALLLLWLLYAAAELAWQPIVFGVPLALGAAAGALSPIGHSDALLRGVFDSADVLYFLIFAACFLALTVVRLDMDQR